MVYYKETMNKTAAIIVAGGNGKRMGMDIKKQYILLDGREILAHTLDVFDKCTAIDEIVIVVAEDEISKVSKDIVNKYGYNKKIKILGGGKERQDSVYEGLKAVSDEVRYVAIHDGARPFIETNLIEEAIKVVRDKKAVVLGVPVKDTIKEAEQEEGVNKITNTPDRSRLWAIQTPQVFERELILNAYEYINKENMLVTDDSMVAEAYGESVYIIKGDYNNIKITTKEDLIIGEAILNIKKNYK